MSKLKVVEHNVQVLTQIKPEVKYNRNRLVAEYWRRFDGAEYLDDASRCTSAESIIRTFRRLKERGVVAVTEEEENRLKEAEQDFRDYFGGVIPK